MKILFFIVLLTLSACSTPGPSPAFSNGVVKSQSLNAIELGMSRDQVLAMAGEPSMKSAYDGAEFWRYRSISGDPRYYIAGGWENYYIRFNEGKVSEYGKLGDFGSTRNTGIDVNVRMKE